MFTLELFRGDADVRRKTRAGRGSHWAMALGCKHSLNSILVHGEIIRKLHSERQKPTLDIRKISKFGKVRRIFTQKGFRGKKYVEPTGRQRRRTSDGSGSRQRLGIGGGRLSRRQVWETSIIATSTLGRKNDRQANI